MKLSERLRNLFRKPSQDERIGELEERVRKGIAIAELKKMAGWDVFIAEIAQQDQKELEGFLKPMTHEHYIEQRGVCAGLRRAANLPNDLIEDAVKAENELKTIKPVDGKKIEVVRVT